MVRRRRKKLVLGGREVCVCVCVCPDPPPPPPPPLSFRLHNQHTDSMAATGRSQLRRRAATQQRSHQCFLYVLLIYTYSSYYKLIYLCCYWYMWSNNANNLTVVHTHDRNAVFTCNVLLFRLKLQRLLLFSGVFTALQIWNSACCLAWRCYSSV